MDIRRGRLIFTGGPVDNPGIDIQAIRKFPDVTAGVNVRGTLLQPRLSFFSEPSLAQAEIVSLLLSGSLSATPTRPNGTANNAALVQGGAILAQELGQHVGIQQVGVESDLLTNDTSLVLGRYLSPRLYVSYGISLTEQLNTLKLRYSLGDHWVVRTEVGQARGADLIYTIEK
jgi:translocation and assembly module TamB